VNRRLTRVVLALLMVPVVLLASSQTAHAANAWHQITMQPVLPGYPDAMKCTANVKYADDAQSLYFGAGSVCQGIPDFSPGYLQSGEPGSTFKIDVRGDAGGGSPCIGTESGTFGAHPNDSTMNVVSTFGGFHVETGPHPLGCEVLEVCITLDGTVYGGDGGDQPSLPACAHVDLGEPEITQGQCIHGDVHGIELIPNQQQRVGSTTVTDYWWSVRVYLNNNQGADGSWDKWRVSKSTSFSTDSTLTGVSTGTRTLTFELAKTGTATASNDAAAKLAASKPTSLQIYALDQIRNTGTNYDTSANVIASVYPPANPEGAYRGLTQPPLCRFYYGTKLVDFPNTSADDPGTIDVLPPEDEPTAEPTVVTTNVTPDDTGTDNSLLSLLAGLLRLILAAIKAIVGAVKALGTAIAGIADAILDGIKDFFVPDNGFMNSEYSEIRDAWEATTMWRYVEEVETMTSGNVSGCNGVPLDLTLAGGVEVHQRIGAACTGTMASVASVVRMVISAGIVVAGTFAVIRIVGAGFGWAPGVGRGADA